MNDTQQPPDDAGPEGPGSTRTDEPHLDPGFTTGRMRSLADVHRPSGDRLVAGVCTGVARHLDVDPVIVRIGFAVLTFVGGAGIILYAAAWFLLPTTDGPSPAAEWFKLDETEEKVRTGGLVIAAIVALLAVVGDGGWGGGGWGWGAPWAVIPLALLVYVFVVRPRRNAEQRRQTKEWADDVATRSREMGHEAGDRATAAVDDWKVQRKDKRARRSSALTGLTLSLTAIAIAVTRLVADQRGGTPWTTYVAVSLAVVGLGVLLSTFVGDGGTLIAIGLLLAVTLGVGNLLPSPRIGDQTVRPDRAADVSSTYEHGVGQLELDLSGVSDTDVLVGRTINLQNGVGQTRIIVPDGLAVNVESRLELGEISVFGRSVNGTDNRLDLTPETSRALNLQIDQSVGDIEVISQ